MNEKTKDYCIKINKWLLTSVVFVLVFFVVPYTTFACPQGSYPAPGICISHPTPPLGTDGIPCPVPVGASGIVGAICNGTCCMGVSWITADQRMQGADGNSAGNHGGTPGSSPTGSQMMQNPFGSSGNGILQGISGMMQGLGNMMQGGSQSSHSNYPSATANIKPPICKSITVSPTRPLASGEGATIAWVLSGGRPDTVMVSPGVGVVSGFSVRVTPHDSTTYTIVAKNKKGSSTCKKVRVYVGVTQDGTDLGTGDAVSGIVSGSEVVNDASSLQAQTDTGGEVIVNRYDDVGSGEVVSGGTVGSSEDNKYEDSLGVDDYDYIGQDSASTGVIRASTTDEIDAFFVDVDKEAQKEFEEAEKIAEKEALEADSIARDESRRLEGEIEKEFRDLASSTEEYEKDDSLDESLLGTTTIFTGGKGSKEYVLRSNKYRDEQRIKHRKSIRDTSVAKWYRDRDGNGQPSVRRVQNNSFDGTTSYGGDITGGGSRKSVRSTTRTQTKKPSFYTRIKTWIHNNLCFWCTPVSMNTSNLVAAPAQGSVHKLPIVRKSYNFTKYKTSNGVCEAPHKDKTKNTFWGFMGNMINNAIGSLYSNRGTIAKITIVDNGKNISGSGSLCKFNVNYLDDEDSGYTEKTKITDVLRQVPSNQAQHILTIGHTSHAGTANNTGKRLTINCITPSDKNRVVVIGNAVEGIIGRSRAACNNGVCSLSNKQYTTVRLGYTIEKRVKGSDERYKDIKRTKEYKIFCGTGRAKPTIKKVTKDSKCTFNGDQYDILQGSGIRNDNKECTCADSDKSIVTKEGGVIRCDVVPSPPKKPKPTLIQRHKDCDERNGHWIKGKNVCFTKQTRKDLKPHKFTSKDWQKEYDKTWQNKGKHYGDSSKNAKSRSAKDLAKMARENKYKWHHGKINGRRMSVFCEKDRCIMRKNPKINTEFIKSDAPRPVYTPHRQKNLEWALRYYTRPRVNRKSLKSLRYSNPKWQQAYRNIYKPQESGAHIFKSANDFINTAKSRQGLNKWHYANINGSSIAVYCEVRRCITQMGDSDPKRAHEFTPHSRHNLKKAIKYYTNGNY